MSSQIFIDDGQIFHKGRIDVDGFVLNELNEEFIGHQCHQAFLNFAETASSPFETGQGQDIIVLKSYWGNGYFHVIFNELQRYFRTCHQEPSNEVEKLCQTALFFTSAGGILIDFLALFGVGRERIIDQLPPKIGTVLVARGCPCGRFHDENVAQGMWRALRLPSPVQQPPRRTRRVVWIHRNEGAARSIVNFQEKIRWIFDWYNNTPAFWPASDLILEPMQIDVYRHLSIVECQQFFRDVFLIVGPHGAGLSNMLFANPGVALLEIHPGRYASERAVHESYAVISLQLGIPYAQVVGDNGDSFTPGIRVREETLHAGLNSLWTQLYYREQLRVEAQQSHQNNQ